MRFVILSEDRMRDRLSRYLRQSSPWQRGTLVLIAGLLVADVGLFLYAGADGTPSLWTSGDSRAQQATSANESRSSISSDADSDVPGSSEGSSAVAGEYVTEDGDLVSSGVPNGAGDTEVFGALPILLPDGDVLGSEGDLGQPGTEAADGTTGEGPGDAGDSDGAGGTDGSDGAPDGGGGTGDGSGPVTPEPTTPGPTTPGPTTPEPTTPEPTEPEPTEPEPTTPEPTTPDPTEPEPTTPEPTEPEPTQPEPTQPEPTQPESTEEVPDSQEEEPASQP